MATWNDNAGYFRGVNANNQAFELTLDQIEKMSIHQFINIDGYLVNVDWNRRYDTVVFETNTTVPEGGSKKIFRKGLEEKDEYFESVNTYTKTLVHTNMLKGGEFDEGDLTVIKNLEVELPMFGGKPTTQAAGVVTNAKASFPATFDPALAAYRFLNQTWIQFMQGKDVIFENKALYFASKAWLLAAFGANSGAYVQNGYGQNYMRKPRIIRGSRDFSVNVISLASYDLTTATGLNMEVSMTIALETTELREENP